ncbi:hypothetical protein LIER_01098 [Lithospermum erythrorhizon]|uniref:Uncharacterized protein n=1 Tax=Lithospermum erythrorhizon TaxID=34254 RepID=A0AAV3NJN9_LITER
MGERGSPYLRPHLGKKDIRRLSINNDKVLDYIDTLFDELNPMRREVELFKEVQKKVLTNTIKSFVRINFDGSHIMLFIFGKSDGMSEFGP